MILDCLENLEHYVALHPLSPSLVDFIKKTDLYRVRKLVIKVRV
jgi:beta-galactosidase beta subunit